MTLPQLKVCLVIYFFYEKRHRIQNVSALRQPQISGTSLPDEDNPKVVSGQCLYHVLLAHIPCNTAQNKIVNFYTKQFRPNQNVSALMQPQLSTCVSSYVDDLTKLCCCNNIIFQLQLDVVPFHMFNVNRKAPA